MLPFYFDLVEKTTYISIIPKIQNSTLTKSFIPFASRPFCMTSCLIKFIFTANYQKSCKSAQGLIQFLNCQRKGEVSKMIYHIALICELLISFK